ncbi:hypothetical protein ACFPRL_21365 [Pseudoclavibacter helvolus]
MLGPRARQAGSPRAPAARQPAAPAPSARRGATEGGLAARPETRRAAGARR